MPPHVRREAKAFTLWIERTLDVRHRLIVELEGDRKFIGAFMYEKAPAILVAAGLSARTVLESIAHEFVHYEQWRDGKPMTERGVESRALALVRRYKREMRA